MDWKLFRTNLAPFYDSYVELASFLGLFLLAAAVLLIRQRRQFWRRVVQVVSLVLFFFVVNSCLGVFGLIRNALRGLQWAGRDDLQAFYWLGLTAVILALAFNVGAIFCGWICPTGTLQEFMGCLGHRWRRFLQRGPRGRLVGVLALSGGYLVYLAVVYHVFNQRKPLLEDSAVLWASSLVVILYFALLFPHQDRALKRLRGLSLVLLLLLTAAGLTVTSPVHFVFTNVHDGASLLSTLVLMGASLFVTRSWCRYLCPFGLVCSATARFALYKIRLNDRCIGCRRCDAVCETGAISRGHIDELACTLCLACVDVCPEAALEVWDWRAGAVREA